MERKSKTELVKVYGVKLYILLNNSPVQPNLSDAYLKNRVPVGTMHKNILDALVSIDSDMKEKSDYEKDKLDRLAVIARLLPTFSLDELKYLWQDVKSQDCDIV